MAFSSITEKGALAGLLALLLVTPSCSGLLYYPTRYEHLNPALLGLYPERVWFATEDGVRLNGWHFINKTGQPAKATVVFFHGNAQNISTHFGTLTWLLDYPYDYFIFDYRGYGKSEGVPSPKGTLLDGKAAIHWVQYRDIEDGHPGRPIVVFGQSLGGAIALRSAYEMKDRSPIRLVVADSTFPSYQEVGRKVLSRSWITWILQPLTYLLLSDRYAPGDRIAEISPIPLVVIHGKEDQVVDYELGEEIFEIARPPKEFWSVPDGRHTDAFWKKDPRWRDQFVQELERVTSPSSSHP